jgi:hypothetical protein
LYTWIAEKHIDAPKPIDEARKFKNTLKPGVKKKKK